jgi:hypothetical protein
MPSGEKYRCKSCNEELLILPKDFLLAPFPEKWVLGPPNTATREERVQRSRDMEEWARVHHRAFVCNPCEVQLFLPRQIDAAMWNEWKRKDLGSHRPHTDYPFLVRLVRLVDDALASSNECVIDFGQLCCPYCSQVLVAGDKLSPKCPHCGSSEMEHVDSGIATMSASFPRQWPPIV